MLRMTGDFLEFQQGVMTPCSEKPVRRALYFFSEKLDDGDLRKF